MVACVSTTFRMSPSWCRKIALFVLLGFALISLWDVSPTSAFSFSKKRKLRTNSFRVNKLPPVILVPGDGGSQIEAKLDKPQVVHYFCNRKTDTYFDLWLNLQLLVPYVLDCWVDNMRLVYNNVTRTTSNSLGVDIQIPGFGNTTTVEWLDPSRVYPSAYFTNIVEGLLPLGYQRGINILGAPYDFRKAPNELGDFLQNVKTMVEQAYQTNGNTPVILVGHSMGCPMMLYLLNQQSSSWKAKYIRAFVTMAGPWGGAVKVLKAFASGENLGIIVINPLTVRAEQRSSPSMAFLAPSDKFWGKDEVLVSTLKRNYTVNDYRDFFNDIDFPDGYEMWLDTRNLVYNLDPPNVEVHCLHGNGVDTFGTLTYTKDSFPNVQPKVQYGDGDGTVNIRSLKGCLRWQGQQKQKVYHKEFPKVDHMAILSEVGMIDYLKDLITRG